jgi:hypothetical protein
MTNESALKRYRRKIEAAEATLAKARELMSGYAERKGLSTAGIFGDCKFVLRTTAHRWEAAAKREGQDEIAKVWVASLDKSPSPFAHLGGTPPFGHLAVQPAPEAPLGKPRLVVDNRPAAETIGAPTAEGVNRDITPQGAA